MFLSTLTENRKMKETAPVQVPEGVALVFTGTTLCGVPPAGASPDEIPLFGEHEESALTTVAGHLGLKREKLTAAFTCVRTLPFDSFHNRRTTVHLLPPSWSVMPTNIRRVWKGALSLDGATHVAFVVGEVKSLLNVSNYMMVSGHLEPLGEIWRDRILQRMSELSATEERVTGVAVRLIAERLVRGERAEIESRLVMIGLAGVSKLARSGVTETTRGVESNLSPAMLTVNNTLRLTRLSADVEIGLSVKRDKEEELARKTKEGALTTQGGNAASMLSHLESNYEQVTGVGRKLRIVAVTADGV
jgi:hypothetical protein